MNSKLRLAIFGIIAGTSMLAATSANAACSAVTRTQFEAAANTAATETDNFGFGQAMWATMVDETGMVCHVYSTNSGVANTGALAGNQAWLLSRVISAQKANTANSLSTDNSGGGGTTLFPNGLAISTGAVYVGVVPGGSLYGLQHSNPVDASKAYGGSPVTNGTNADFLKNKRIGGVNVFGGGVALYNGSGKKVGAIGASGDTSCRDHAFAYRLRINLGLNNPPNDDGLQLIASPSAVTGLFQQPACGVNDPSTSADNSSGSDFGVRP